MRRSLFRFALTGLLAIGLSTASHAAIMLNEIFVNPPGSDNGQEFIELKSTTGGVESMAGLTLLIIEGDGSSPGLIDQALPLSSFSTGTNGLFLWRDASSVISPAPHVDTTLNVADFSPDIENGSNTFLIVSGFTGMVGSDIDVDNNGLVDATFWTSVIDGLGFIENDGASNVAYGADLGFLNFGPDAGFNADVLVRLENGIWFGSDVTGTNPGGPYDFDPARAAFQNGAAANIATLDITTATPGNTNPTANPIPEPSTYALLGTSAIGLAFLRRRRTV